MCIDNISLGKNIRKNRKNLGLTLEELAEKSEISINFLGNIERGTDTPSLKSLMKICNALNISADVVLIDNLSVYNKENLNTGYHKDLNDEISSLSVEQQGKLFEILELIKKFY